MNVTFFDTFKLKFKYFIDKNVVLDVFWYNYSIGIN